MFTVTPKIDTYIRQTQYHFNTRGATLFVNKPLCCCGESVYVYNLNEYLYDRECFEVKYLFTFECSLSINKKQVCHRQFH